MNKDELSPETIERFWERVEKSPAQDDCWTWKSAHISAGYGTFHVYKPDRQFRVHRLAYELLIGEIPEGLELDHLCRNRGCCNPGHLEPVTKWENTRRGKSFTAAHAAKTHCPEGHPYSGDNLYVNPSSGSRNCRICMRVKQRERAARRRAVSAGTAASQFPNC